jgi:predicted secreted protein
MTTRQAVCAVGGVVLLAGLGGAAAPAVGSTATGSHATGPTVQASWADDGHTISLRSGQAIRVALPGQTCTATSIPVATKAPVLRVRRVGSSGGLSWAVFQAEKAGTTVVTATHGEACAMGVSDYAPEQFRLTVRVR